MNQHPGILGRKLGMTQLVAEDGTVTPVTVIQTTCVVAAKRTQEKNGYTALVLSIDDRKAKRTSKALAGQYRTAMGALKSADGEEPKEESKVTPGKALREFRCSPDHAAKFELGDAVKLDDVFTVGQFVDVRGLSRGRGFTGVMRRHNFAGSGASHGAHEYKRHGGSVGTNMTPGRVLPGLRMPGQYGNSPVSVLSQKIVKLVPEQGLVMVAGGVPGSRNGIVEVRGAVKKKPVK
jgi:large subunit ribosomal protein L3